MTDHVENIGEPGAQRRQRNGLVWVAVTGVMVVVFIVMNVPRPTRLLIAIPVGLAAVGFLQAREKTWVVLGALGKREVYELGANTDLSDYERRTVRRQALSVVLRSAAIALVAAAIAWAV